MVGVVSEDSVPEWVKILLGERFFTACSVHESAKKNEKTFFCMYCCESICSHCLCSHGTHRLLQIRRYVYHDVIRLDDAEGFLDCSLVQPYTTNSAKVVFLKQRPTTRPFRGSGSLCITCCRTLQHPYLFCSLYCKIHHQVTDNTEIDEQHENYDQILPPIRARIESLSELQDIKTTPSSVFEHDFPSASTTTVATAGRPAAYSATTESVACVNSLTAVLCPPRCFPVADLATAVNRRKGIPQRSPLS